MIKRMIVMLLCCAVVAAGIIGFKWFGNKMMMQAMAGMANPVHTVSTTKATTTAWQDELKSVGTLHAAKGSDLSNEVAGIVENIFLESGEDVSEGTSFWFNCAARKTTQRCNADRQHTPCRIDLGA